TRSRRASDVLPSSSASASQGWRTSGRPCCSRLINSRSNSSIGDLEQRRRKTTTALFERPRAEQQLVRYIAQVVVRQQAFDQLADLFALAAMDHAEQVVRPLRQTPRALIAEIDSGGLAQAPPDFVDLCVGDVHHQHGVGAKAQRAVLEHQ